MFNFVTNLESCTDVPQLIYYSHIPVIFITLLLGTFVFLKNRKGIANMLIFFLAIDFSLWCVFDLIIWTNTDSSKIMFFWMSIIPLDLLIFIFSAYLQYVFLNKVDVTLRTKYIFFLILLPVLVLMPSRYNLSGFDNVSCNGIDGLVGKYYLYASELLILILVIIIAIKKIIKEKDPIERTKAVYFSISLFIFLCFFLLGNLIASIFETSISWWSLSQYGLFGMVFFIGVLTYLIVQYKVFEIRMLGAQALVVSLVVLIASQFFFIQNGTNRILTGITLALSVVFGWILIASVKKEVERKEELQRISDSLAVANSRLKELDNTKTEFISIASHQLRTPLTAIKGYLSLLLEGSYGTISVEITDVLEKLNIVNRNLIQLVEDLLNVSRIDAGRIQYSYEPTRVETLVADKADMFMPLAHEKGIALSLHLPAKALPEFMLDAGKIREAVSNLIDNALKYTAKGSIAVSIEPVGNDDAVRIAVTDTGIGFSEEDGRMLFGKFVRTKETSKVYVIGTGLGLYVGKSFVEAHGGRIWAESDGVGKGSRFIIELPLVNPKASAGSARLGPIEQ